MLELHGITVRFGPVTALEDVDLTVADDETVAILGPSGSGKSTLLRVAAGLATPDAGRVLWNGEDITQVPTHERGFGLVFQDFALFPHLDVAGNVAFGLRMADLDRNEIDARVSAALARVGLSGLERRKIVELSGGQAQRVALARTLAPRPRLLLLDEPLGSLDPALRGDLAADLAATLARDPVPALLVTHDTDEAFALADRVAILDRGHIVRRGTPQEVWESPGTETAARLMGHTVVPGSPDGGQLHWGGASVSPVEGSHLIALRPDALHIDPDGPIEATVVASAYRGPEHVLTVDADGHRMKVIHDAPVAPGVSVRLRADASGMAAVGA